MGADWTPVIVALAALLMAITAQIPTLVVTLRNHEAINRVESVANGKNTALAAKVEELQRAIALKEARSRKGEEADAS